MLTPDDSFGPFYAVSGDGVAPVATAFWAVPDDVSYQGQDVYFQWLVNDTGARSRTARATIFCGLGGCAPVCRADVNGDGLVLPNDLSAWIQSYNAQTPNCDQNGDGKCLPNDFSAWIINYNAGC